MSISCLNITLDIYDQNAYKIWSNYFQNNEIDIFRELKTELSEIDKLYLSGNTYLEVITDCAKKIQYYKRELLPLMAYLND